MLRKKCAVQNRLQLVVRAEQRLARQHVRAQQPREHRHVGFIDIRGGAEGARRPLQVIDEPGPEVGRQARRRIGLAPLVHQQRQRRRAALICGRIHAKIGGEEFGAQRPGLFARQMLPDESAELLGGQDAVIGQLQFVNDDERDIGSGAGGRIDAGRKHGIVGVPFDRIGQHAPDRRNRHACADEPRRLFLDLRVAGVALDGVAQVGFVFDRGRSHEIVDEPGRRLAGARADLGVRLRPFGVVVDPGFMRGVGEHEPQPPLELAAQHRLDMARVPQHAATTDGFTNAGNVSCHGRSFDGQRTRPRDGSRYGAPPL